MMKVSRIPLRGFPLAAGLALAGLLLLPGASMAQRDTLRLQAINDTLAICPWGDTLLVNLQHDTTMVIVERPLLMMPPLPACDTLGQLDTSIGAASGKRNFFDRVTDVSKIILKQTRIKVGQNVGASAPFGLPENSTVLSFAPIFAPSIAIEKKFTIHNRFYGLAGLRFEYKGMKTRAAVEDFQTEVPQELDGQILIFAGSFTGENVTNVVVSYISIPMRVGFQITKNYALEAGGFVAFALSRGFSGKVENGYLWTRPSESDPGSSKIPISSADYNFNDKISKFDAGVELYGSHHLGANILLDAGLGVGLVPLFNLDKFKGIPFTMYNIYLNVAVGYRFN